MAFVDELQMNIFAGNGGDGVVRFLHAKGKEFMGPAGGNGGRGGDVYIRTVRDAAILSRYTSVPEWKADDGAPGGNRSQAGMTGKNLIIDLPIGTKITNLDTGEEWHLLVEHEEQRILRGGDGGFGNEYFKSSTNQAPEKALPGRDGESGVFHIELQLVADAGFIGYPNAGKSTLLNTLTNTSVKTANYAFTTLEPNLGAFYSYILADIPGLIEGAADGKGLGHKFLRHIKRTGILIHCISADTTDALADYQAIRKELGNFSQELLNKKELIVITKTDEVDDEWLESLRNELKNSVEDTTILDVTILDDDVIKKFSDNLITYLRHNSDREE